MGRLSPINRLCSRPLLFTTVGSQLLSLTKVDRLPLQPTTVGKKFQRNDVHLEDFMHLIILVSQLP